MAINSVSPEAARELIEVGALLVDIRAADEYARERISGSLHLPMDDLRPGDERLGRGRVIIFHCQSGNRTRFHAQKMSACVSGTAHALAGGLDAWKRAGMPVETDRSQPIALQRQVQITAGTIVLIGVVLGVSVSPWFNLIPGFVGAGLVFAGASGFCGLARVLMRAPWNRSVL